MQHRTLPFILLFLLPTIDLTDIQVGHGLSIPLVKAGYHIPRTISSALSSSDPEPIPLANITHTHSTATPADAVYSRGRRRDNAQAPAPMPTPQHPTSLQLNRSVIRPKSPTASESQAGTELAEEPERPVRVVTHEG